MPTIPIEESDYAAGSGALSGERIFKNTDPATTVRAESENTIWHGLRTIVRQEQLSGDLTGANYAAELAAGFLNLSKAIRRASRRLVSGSLTLTAGSLTFTLSRDVFAFNILEDSSRPGAIAYLSQSDFNYNDRRLVVITNLTATHKYVGTSTPTTALVCLMPGESAEFYGVPGTSETDWQVIGAPKQGIIDMEMRNASTQIDTGKLYWSVSGFMVNIAIETMGAALGSGAALTICGVGNDVLPSFLDFPNGFASYHVPIMDNSVRKMGLLTQSGAAGSRKFSVLNLDTTNFAAGACDVSGVNISFPLRSVHGS